MMKLPISTVVLYTLYVIPHCITDGSLTFTKFRFLSQQIIYKATKKEAKSVVECAARSSVKGERLFSYNPFLRLCVLGARGSGSLSNGVIPDEKRWILYFKEEKASVEQAAEQHPAAKEETAIVLYDIIAENGTLVLFWHHISILNRDTPSAKVTFKTSVLIPGAETVCYNKGNNKLYIIYKRPGIQELFSREGIQGTDGLEARINSSICGKAKRLHIDHQRQEFFFLTDKGVCFWNHTFPERLIIERKRPWRMQLYIPKMRIYWIDGEHNDQVMFSTYKGATPTRACGSKYMMGLAVDQRGTYFTCSLRGGIKHGCSSTVILEGRKKWQECVSMTAWKDYLFMVNNVGVLKFVSLKKKILMNTKHYSVAIAKGAYSKHPYRIQDQHNLKKTKRKEYDQAFLNLPGHVNVRDCVYFSKGPPAHHTDVIVTMWLKYCQSDVKY